VRSGADEPFGFELHREAWSQRTTNPRSALLLGVAAVEIGFKECVAGLVPDAAWLAREAPTPQVVRMLREYLPTLPAANTIGGKVVPPPEQHLDRLKKAVNARNQLAHKGGASPTGRDLRLLLVDMKEILWLLAYYAGSSWALHHLSLETRQALGDHLTANEQEILARS
jgi:hypothetical protein